MKRLFYILFFLIGANLYFFGQVSGDFVEKKAIEIKDRQAGNDTLYEAIKNYKAILIGGMHGTAEPPEFFLGIVKSLLKNGKKVVAALEIPKDGIDIKKIHSLEDIKKANAFSSTSPDGRQCLAWAHMLLELKKTKAEIFCFDLTMEYKGDRRIERDSMMYININGYLKKDTSRVLVVLSGNISNMLIPYNKNKTMACYLAKSKKSCLKGKNILSLNYLHGEGTVYNWSNEGYKLRESESNAPFYEHATSYDNYLFIYPVMPGYNGILFSKTITASEPLVEHK